MGAPRCECVPRCVGVAYAFVCVSMHISVMPTCVFVRIRTCVCACGYMPGNVRDHVSVSACMYVFECM